MTDGPLLDAVLFDMDGTLTDSEKLWTLALQEVAAAHGGVISGPTRELMVGQDMWATIDLLHGELGLSVDPADTAQRLTSATLAVFRAGLPWKAGARELLSEVRAAGLRTALVTATHRELVTVALDTLGEENFDVIVCGDEVTRNKPDPEPYLRALDLLGVAADRALAVEDSPAGSAAAAAAGLPVLVVPSEMPVPPADGLLFAETLVGLDVPALRTLHAGRAIPA